MAISSLTYNAFAHEQDSRRADAKDLQEDIKLVTAQFEALSKPDPVVQNLAFATINYTRSRHEKDQSPALAKFFDSITNAANARAQTALDPATRAQGAAAAAKALSRPDTVERNLTPPPTGPATSTATAQLPPVNPVTSAKPSVAYIQFYCARQQGDADQIKQALLNAGVPAPGSENVVAKHPDQAATLQKLARSEPEVRFFHAEDADAAQFAAKLLGDTLRAPSVYLRNLAGRYGNVKSGMVEIWLPYNAQTCPA
ncbi:hypothetical protein [Novosphingobium sp. FKTRR1]|uniref:hypothetical protein n=1 Tax=unclassified Novosphingobium TaxID=2644732 RepID=UPI001CF0C8D9|nr:hypothetical protein [Novosphingobium sp. FKTRR1]